jgi:uncharacterized protein (DUF1015 family)
VSHRVWAVSQPEELAAIADDLVDRQAVIADGHHRYTTYLYLQEQQRAAGADAGPWDFGLTLLVDTAAFGPQVHAIHRVLPGLGAGAAADRLGGACSVRRIESSLSEALGELARAGADGAAYVIADASERFLVTAPDADLVERSVPADHSAAWRGLDVTVLHLALVPGPLGLADTEAAVRYAHDVDEALAIAAATDGCAVLLNPTPVTAVIAAAQAGDRMPRKSTLFTPKPRTGLLLRAFADG